MESLRNIPSGALGFVRNAYHHEPYNLLQLDERSTLKLLFFASYLLRLIDPSSWVCHAGCLPPTVRAAYNRSVRAGLNDEPFLAEVSSPNGVTGLHLSEKLASMSEPLKVLGLQESKATISDDEFALVKHIDKRHQFALPNDVEPGCRQNEKVR
jgi:hypothetical protein